MDQRDQRDQRDRTNKRVTDLDIELSGNTSTYEPALGVPCPTCGHVTPRAPMVQPPDGPDSPLYPPPR